jgi:hypothetical protein
MVDDRGHELDADYHGEPDGPHIALILESRSGRNPPQPPRNGDYNPVLELLLARLGKLDALLVDALLDTGYTQRLGMPEAARRLIKSPVPLAQEPDTALLRRQMGNTQAQIGRTSEGSRSGENRKRIRLRVDVPGYQPGEAARLAERLAAPITEAAENELSYSPVEQAEEAVQDAAGKAARPGTGQGFQRDQEVKAKVEARAMNMATEFYAGKGWTVQDVHLTESYDKVKARKRAVFRWTSSSCRATALTLCTISSSEQPLTVALMLILNAAITAPLSHSSSALTRVPVA